MLKMITYRDDTTLTCLYMHFGLLKEISFIFYSWKCDVCWFFCDRTLKYVTLRILLKQNTALLSHHLTSCGIIDYLKILKMWITDWLTDNLKSRDTSASKNITIKAKVKALKKITHFFCKTIFLWEHKYMIFIDNAKSGVLLKLSVLNTRRCKMCTTTRLKEREISPSTQNYNNNPWNSYIVGNQHKDNKEHRISKHHRRKGEKVFSTNPWTK